MRVPQGTMCFQHKSSKNKDELCPICHEEMNSQCKTLPCGHEFHRKCIKSWKDNAHHTCPMCRQPFCEMQKMNTIIITSENRSQEISSEFSLEEIGQFIRQMGYNYRI